MTATVSIGTGRWTFGEALVAARRMLDREYDWNEAAISMTYSPLTGWLISLDGVSLIGHIERIEVILGAGVIATAWPNTKRKL